MSKKGQFYTLLAAGLPATVATALTTFKAWGNAMTTYITTTVGGAGTCTLSLESSHDGSNWFVVTDPDSAASWTIDVNVAGKFEYIILAGLIPGNEYRLSYSCGVAAGTIAIDAISWENPAGSIDITYGDIHADIGAIEVDVDVLEGIVHVEDVAHTTADPGVMPLAVRNDTAGTLADTDGDYAPLQVNADGNVYSIDETAEALLTTIDVDTSDIATLVHLEDVAHTTADPGVQTLAVRNDTLASLCDTDGDYAPVQVDADGAVYTLDETAEALLTAIDLDTSDLATLVHLEDVAHVTADPGVQVLAVRNDTLATLADTDGDYAPVQVNADGAVYTEVATLPGGLTGHAEDDAHTTADVGIEMLAVRNDTLASLCDTDGDYAPVQVDADGAVYTVDETAEALLTAIDLDTSDVASLVHLEDVAHTTADPGIEVLAVRNDTLASLCDTDGDYTPVQVDADGAVYMVDETAEALLTAIDLDTSDVASLVHLEDAAHVTADPGVQMLSVRNDTLAALCDTDGDYVPTQVDADGALYTVDETVEALLTDIPNVIGTDGAAGPSKAVSVAGTDGAGNLQEVRTDTSGNVGAIVTDGTTDAVVTAALTALKVDIAGGAGAALSATNPLFAELTDGAAAIGAANPLNVEIGNGTIQAEIDDGATHDSLKVRITDGTNLCSISGTGDLEVSGNAGAALATQATLATIDLDTSKIPSLGTAAMAASAPATIATDDTQFGAVGAAADVDGNIHGQLRSIGEAVEAVRVAPLVLPYTGAGAVDIDTAIGAAWELLYISVKLSAAGTTAEDFAVVHDSNDGAAYDFDAFTLDLSTDSVTSLIISPMDQGSNSDQLPRFYESGDELNIDWPNTEVRTYGIRIVYRLL